MQTLYIIIIVILIFVDQFSKFLFYDYWFLSNLYIFTPLFNSWISWWIKLIPELIIIFLTILIIIYICFLYYNKQIKTSVFLLIISWAIWNLVDRLVFWWVRDFLDLHYWPVFNLADSYVTIWVLLFLKHTIKSYHKK